MTMRYSYIELAKMIDHSLLHPTMTDQELEDGCKVAAKYGVASVCIKPYAVKRAAELLKGTGVFVGAVIGFPHGNSTTATKVFETKDAIANGATEIDVVINIGELRSGHADYVRAEIKAVVEAAHPQAIVKVIFENAYLTDEQKVVACQLCEAAGADFVKTSTGFAPSGATVADIRLMRANVGPHVQVKCAHGVRTLDALLEMIDAGATRSGATTTAIMLDEFKQRGGG